VTSPHRDLKRKLRAGYRALSQHMSYLCVVKPVLFFIVKCGIAHFLCACVHYVRIRRSGIILAP